MNIVAAATAGLAGSALLVLVVVALRRPLLARIAYRQVVRRPGQSALMVLGMMFASGAIMAMSGVADVDQKTTDDQILFSLGRVDMTVAAAGKSFSPAVADQLGTDPRVRAQGARVTGGLELVGGARDLDRGAVLPTVQLVGLDRATMAPFGGFQLTDGRRMSVADLGPGNAVLSEFPARRINAHVGDHLRVLFTTASGESASINVTMTGVARAAGAGASGQVAGVFLPLADLQHAARTDRINVVRITVPGQGQAEVDAADRAMPPLRRALAAIPEAAGLDLREVKRDDLAYNSDAISGPGLRLTLLTVSLLVVLAGVAVVVNLALAMAEERRPRLAVLRALGLSRREMVAANVMESALYGVAGAVLGVVPGIAFEAYQALLKSPPPPDLWTSMDLPGQFTIDPWSVLFAVAAGVIVSLATVLVASLRTSRMTVSSAIKDLPDPARRDRPSWRRWSWVAGMGVVGAAAVATPFPVLRDVGGALLLVTASAAVRGVVPERIRASLAGAGLSGWGFGFLFLAPGNAFLTAVGTAVVAVVLGVVGLALVFSANLGVLESIVTVASSRVGASLRPPLAYLTRRPVRTGLTTGTFGLVLAGLTLFAVFLGSLVPTQVKGADGWDMMVGSSGDGALTLPASSRPDVAAQYVIRTASFVAPVRDSSPYPHDTFVMVMALSDEQLQHPPIRLGRRDARYPTDAAVWRAMRDDPSLTVSSGTTSFGDSFSVGGQRAPATFRNVGLADTSFFVWGTNWFIVSERALDRLPAAGLGTLILVKTASGVDPDALASAIRGHTSDGFGEVWTASQNLAFQSATQTWWITTFFSDLFDVGLVVGVMSLAVMALRAVVERRKSIGVLRALGYQPRDVLAALLVEAILLTSVGVVTGLVVGLGVGYAFVTNPGISVTTHFGVEIPRVVAPVVLVYAAILLAGFGPALRASRLPVADTLRIVG